VFKSQEERFCSDKKNGISKEARKEFTLEQVRKKLESIGIIINVDRLMNEK
jgi:hypothetical protein